MKFACRTWFIFLMVVEHFFFQHMPLWDLDLFEALKSSALCKEERATTGVSDKVQPVVYCLFKESLTTNKEAVL